MQKVITLVMLLNYLNVKHFFNILKPEVMTPNKVLQKTDWLQRSIQLLRNACTPWGIKASLTDLDNYNAIFTRDAVMAGIGGILLNDEVIKEGLKNTLLNLKKIQGDQGQIASNFTIKNGEVAKVSFGSLSPKIDSCTWYLVGVGLLIKDGVIKKEDFKISVEKTIDLLDAIEYNGKHLIYVPKGGNWADEYTFEGYILYDQVLRIWGLKLLASIFDNKEWADKATAILKTVEANYKDEKGEHFYASLYPGGVFEKFDLAGHSLIGLILEKEHSFFTQTLEWIEREFLAKQKFPPAFYPVIKEGEKDWETLKKFHLFGFKNKPYHYHNGGIWWIWIGWLAIVLKTWKKEEALNQLIHMSFTYLNQLEEFQFEEYISSDDLIPNGTKKLCYSATGVIFLCLAKKAFEFNQLKSF